MLQTTQINALKLLDLVPIPVIVYRLKEDNPPAFIIEFANIAHLKGMRWPLKRAKTIIGMDFKEAFPDLGNFDFVTTFYKVLKSQQQISFETKVYDGHEEEDIVSTEIIPVDDQYVMSCWTRKTDKTIIEAVKLKNNELEQLTYITSHDLKEPLQTINTFAKTLKDKYRNEIDAKGKTMIDHMLKSINRMDYLVSSVMAYSLIEEGEVEPVDLNRVLEEVKSDLSPIIKEANATISSDELITIEAIPFKMKQLFLNLISNAIRFRREDVPPKVEINIKENRYEHEFSVRDNGAGIEKEYQERAFRLFRQLDSQNKAQGTGLGLAICKKIIENSGGKIWMDSIPGKGTTVYFTILK